MSDIEKKISLKGIDQVLNDYNRLKTEVDELKNKSRELRQSTEDNSSNTMNELKGMAAQYLSVGAAIGLVTRGVAELLAEQQKVGQVYDENNQKLLQQLSITNQLKSGGKIEEFLKSTGDVDQARNVLSGVMSAAPGMDIKEQFRITKALEPAFAALSSDQASQTGTIAGAFGKLGVKNPESVALLAQADAGRNASQLASPKFLRHMGNLIESGMDPSQAISLGVTSLNEDMGTKWAGKLVDTLVTDEKPGQGDSSKKRSFLKDKDAMSRFERLKADPRMAADVLGDTTAMEFGRFDLGLLDSQASRYSSASNAAEELAKNAKSFGAGSDAYGANAAKALWKKRQAEAGEQLDPWADLREQEYNAINDQSVQDGWGMVITNQARKLGASAHTRIASAMGQNPADVATERLVSRAMGGDFNQDTLKTFEETLRVQGLINEELLVDLRKKNNLVPQAPSRSTHGE